MIIAVNSEPSENSEPMETSEARNSCNYSDGTTITISSDESDPELNCCGLVVLG